MAVVQHPVVKAALPFIGNGAYVAIASGFLMTDILTLRVLLAFGYTGLVTYHMLHTRPLRIPLMWSAVFVCVNIAYGYRIAQERFPAGLTEEDELVHQSFFERLTPAQFLQLLELGERQVCSDGSRLTTEREVCSKLYFVERGAARLKYKGEEVAIIGRGGFVNDVAFQQGVGSSAYGTVECVGEVRAIAWDVKTLREELARNPKLGDDMQRIIVAVLVDQLLQRYKAGEHEPPKVGAGSRLRETKSGHVFRDALEQARSRGQLLKRHSSSAGRALSDPPPSSLPSPPTSPPTPPTPPAGSPTKDGA